MDSFGQHTAAALGKESTVLWIVNSPKVFGYENQKNILCEAFTKKPELKLAYLNKFNIMGEPVEFPYQNENEIFNIEKVFQSLSQN